MGDSVPDITITDLQMERLEKIMAGLMHQKQTENDQLAAVLPTAALLSKTN
jgi:hypothetical protein